MLFAHNRQTMKAITKQSSLCMVEQRRASSMFGKMKWQVEFWSPYENRWMIASYPEKFWEALKQRIRARRRFPLCKYRMKMILPMILMCCIDSPPFVPVNQVNTVEACEINDKTLNSLQPGVEYHITCKGEDTGGTVSVNAVDDTTSYPIAGPEYNTTFDMPEGITEYR
jgi:hypothetical protein